MNPQYKYLTRVPQLIQHAAGSDRTLKGWHEFRLRYRKFAAWLAFVEAEADLDDIEGYYV